MSRFGSDMWGNPIPRIDVNKWIVVDCCCYLGPESYFMSARFTLTIQNMLVFRAKQ